MRVLKKIWHAVRRLSGDDAYERYLAHYARCHADEPGHSGPLTRAEYFKQWQERKWNGINRCC